MVFLWFPYGFPGRFSPETDQRLRPKKPSRWSLLVSAASASPERWECLYMYLYIWLSYTCIYTYVCICMYVYVYIYIYIYLVYIYICDSICNMYYYTIYMYIIEQRYIYVYIYICVWSACMHEPYPVYRIWVNVCVCVCHTEGHKRSEVCVYMNV